MHHRLLPSTCVALGLAVALVACSDDGGGASPADAELSVVEVIELPAPAFSTLQISPEGDAWAQLAGDELCVAPVGAEPSCEPLGDLDPQSFSFRADPLRLLATDDVFVRFREPDVVEVDVASGATVRLTDDGVDELVDGAVIDVQPFEGPGGRVHLFRSTTRLGDEYRFVVARLDDDGAVEEVDGLRLVPDRVPLGPPRPIGDDRFVMSAADLSDGEELVVVLDLGLGTIEPVDTGGIRDPKVVDTEPGRVLLMDLQSFRRLDETNPFFVLDIGTGRLEQLSSTPDDERTMLAAGFVPGGDAVAVAMAPLFDRDSGLGALVVHPLDDTGALGEPVTIAEGDDFLGVDDDGDVVTPIGTGWGTELVWTTNDRLLLATSEQQLLVFDTS
ncbi:MAG: hypothetical protein AAFZ07_12050 [Actinomycetota bacterium]